MLKKNGALFTTAFLTAVFLTPNLGLAATSTYKPAESLLVDHSRNGKSSEEKADHKAKADERKALKVYKMVKNKSWDDLSSKEQKYAGKYGITSAEQYDAWKAQQAAVLAEKNAAKEAKQNAQAYARVKNKSWDDLSSKEKAVAAKHGITSAETYDTWKAQQAALAATKKEADEAKQNAKAYARVKNKTWDQLSKQEKAVAAKHGIKTAEEYDAWKAKQAEAEAAKSLEASEQAKADAAGEKKWGDAVKEEDAARKPATDSGSSTKK